MEYLNNNCQIKCHGMGETILSSFLHELILPDNCVKLLALMMQLSSPFLNDMFPFLPNKVLSYECLTDKAGGNRVMEWIYSPLIDAFAC